MWCAALTGIGEKRKYYHAATAARRPGCCSEFGQEEEGKGARQIGISAPEAYGSERLNLGSGGSAEVAFWWLAGPFVQWQELCVSQC